MKEFALEIELLSDTSFASEMGVSGDVDSEIQHDEYGLPLISGRSVKGMLVNSCADILIALPQAISENFFPAAHNLFGNSGETDENMDKFSIGNGSLSPDLIEIVKYQVKNNKISPELILTSLTDIRRTTAMDPETGAPLEESLRSERVLLRKNKLFVPIYFTSLPLDTEKGLIAACVHGLKRMGLNRRRGRGRVKVRILSKESNREDLTSEWFELFKKEVIK